MRDLERSDYAFGLPTSTDRFYPDFVAALKDGRILAVEYKGEIGADAADTRERMMIGSIWEARRKGRCTFRVVGKRDFEARITEAIRK